ncbi:putative haloalkane dehalogenase [Leptospira fainei serovar Hurstbridge str. BUT 6]|uniref:Haloalkane dehalogenase n=1 Tax=Leptospira fainei serovar Hurstbridge str. BUT 6 TaxID=1193011 RepID=S3UXU3_9LEPT|nr:haloalkane dehalogenase [Leptospira fainei]EPG73174.1 putative haloalkane dehalogenase [Leptospira fainei serovar Hurstbridge str. BUT 6]
MKDFLRTPEENFVNLPNYPFRPNYVQLDSFRMHYLDEGNANAKETLLLLHGEPSWSFLYRKMVPPLINAGYRVVVPDLIGFGKSDKPTDPAVFTYKQHVEWLKSFLLQTKLDNLTLFCQDWGGLLGLRAVAELPDRFGRVCAGNTFLPTGDIPPKEEFLKWRDFSQKVKSLPIGRIIQNGCISKLSKEVMNGYEAPYPDETYKTGARIFPTLVPITPNNDASIDNRNAWNVLRQWKKPFLTAFSDSDPITKGGDIFFRRAVPGAKGQKHVTITNAGHFLQEDKGEELAAILIEFVDSNPV